MNDYDIFIKEMFDETVKPDGELSALARKFYEAGYEHCKQQAPKGLPGVTSDQVHDFIMTLEHEVFMDTIGTACALAQWFNDPNRDAPVKPTMHPDLEWLAQQPAHMFSRNYLGQRTVRFYRANNEVRHVFQDERRVWGSMQIATFTLTEIEQARRHLARQEVNAVVRERSERTVLNDSLDHLPDYETWFEERGHNTVNNVNERGLHELSKPATVHELYTHFRARLLDELRQAGVIGEEK